MKQNLRSFADFSLASAFFFDEQVPVPIWPTDISIVSPFVLGYLMDRTATCRSPVRFAWTRGQSNSLPKPSAAIRSVYSSSMPISI
jgi:hypothetical protein